MKVYIIIYIAALCLALYKKETKLSLLLLFFMFFTTAFRAENVGTDTMNYIYGFSQEAYGMSDYSSRTVEFINLFLYYTVLKNDLNTRYILVFYALITYLGLFFISRQYKVRLSYLLLFFFLTSFYIRGLNISRQVAAVMVLMLGLKYIYEKNFVKSLLFFVFVIFAGGFHASSYLYFILYFLRYIHFHDEKKVAGIAFFLSLLFILNIIPLEALMMRFLPKEYSIYSQSLAVSYKGSAIGMLVILFNLCINCIVLLKYKGNFFELFAFSVVINSSIVGMDFVVSRITLFFSLTLCLAFSSFFATERKQSRETSILFLVILLKEPYFAFSSITQDPTLVNFEFMPFK